jgi:hypothetical protein
MQLPGTTEFGGNTTGLCGGSNAGCGTVYSVSLSGAEHMLHASTSGSDGMFPTAAFISTSGAEHV